MKEWEAAGIKITSRCEQGTAIVKLAFLEDPWGTRIEVVQDPELLGLHHVHLRAPNPEETMTWLLDKFGGKRQPLKGKLDAMRYDYDGFSSVWILVQKGEAEPSQGRAIDHIGWRSVGPLADTMNALRAKKVDSDVRAAAVDASQRPFDQFLVCRGTIGCPDRAGGKAWTKTRPVNEGSRGSRGSRSSKGIVLAYGTFGTIGTFGTVKFVQVSRSSLTRSAATCQITIMSQPPRASPLQQRNFTCSPGTASISMV